jgi:hypothetical protein
VESLRDDDFIFVAESKTGGCPQLFPQLSPKQKAKSKYQKCGSPAGRSFDASVKYQLSTAQISRAARGGIKNRRLSPVIALGTASQRGLFIFFYRHLYRRTRASAARAVAHVRLHALVRQCISLDKSGQKGNIIFLLDLSNG